MWCRFLTFCVLVTLVLIVVLGCLYGRPAIHLFFRRCCSEDIENDQVIYENFGNNFLRERLVGGEIVEVDNVTMYDSEEVESVMENIKHILNVHDPKTRAVINDYESVKEDEGDIENILIEMTERDGVRNVNTETEYWITAGFVNVEKMEHTTYNPL